MPIMDKFDNQFINNVSRTENGLMSATDKAKLDGISLDDIQYIYDGLNDINEELTPQIIYGIKIDSWESNPANAVQYTDNASGFIPLSMQGNTCNYGSWKNIITDFFGIAPCLMKKDGTILTQLNPNNYAKSIDGTNVDIETGTFGQVMIRFKHVYYKYSKDNRYISFQVSNKKIDNTWIDTAFYAEDGIGTVKDEIYISAYETVKVNNILQSLSNKEHTAYDNPSFEEVEHTSQFGVFNMMNITKKQFIIFLSYLVTKTIDLNSAMNYSPRNGVIVKTGTMNDKGLFYGGTTGVKMFGIEHLWGNCSKYMHGLVQRLIYVIDKDLEITRPEQHLYFKEFYPYNDIDDFTDLGHIEPNESGYIATINFLTKSMYIPALSFENDRGGIFYGSSSTYYKTYFETKYSKDSNDRLYGIYGAVPSGNYTNIGPEFLVIDNIKSEDNEAPDVVENPNHNIVSTHLVY